jgi:hypothetical protein
MLKYYDFSGVSFLVDKRFKCENASENGRPPFCPAGVAYRTLDFLQFRFRTTDDSSTMYFKWGDGGMSILGLYIRLRPNVLYSRK